MPGVARQFEPHITRSGGAPSRYRFTARCSGCHNTDIYDASKPAGDELVKGYFKERGWLLGRDRAYDLCPTCLAKPRNGEQPHRSTEARHNGSGASRKQPDDLAPPRDRRHQDTADILARHLGRPEALAAEVFRPKPVQAPHPSNSIAHRQAGSAPALSPGAEQAFAEMAADLKALRSTLELVAEQVSSLVALSSQQIETIARLAPLASQSADSISEGMREVASAARSIPGSAPPEGEVMKPAVEAVMAEEQPAQQPELLQGWDEASGPGAEPAPVVETRKQSRQGRPSRKNEARTPKAASTPVVVKSIPDAKRSDRFYTSIRLPRALWDSAGFGSEDRLLIDWTGKVLTISRVAEGGVKPKTVGEVAVVLQSWKLGNLNLDQPKVSCGESSLRLTGGR